jgi:hypothetical protein
MEIFKLIRQMNSTSATTVIEGAARRVGMERWYMRCLSALKAMCVFTARCCRDGEQLPKRLPNKRDF